MLNPFQVTKTATMVLNFKQLLDALPVVIKESMHNLLVLLLKDIPRLHSYLLFSHSKVPNFIRLIEYTLEL